MSTTSSRRRITVPIAIILAVSSVPLLTGCFGNPLQGAINAATGGKVGLGGGSIPSDFPSAVPVYKGKVDSALGLGTGKDKVWNVTIELPNSDAYKDIKSELTGAGFKTDESGTIGDSGASLIADNKTYGVLVVVTENTSSKQWVANYTVTPDDATD
ncbi:MAG TPA: hypothetical protein VHX87_05250 [Galbitalea sp.]|jgi:hypothetical protein|nr:hypothetical protein [Galbitalea sp.]